MASEIINPFINLTCKEYLHVYNNGYEYQFYINFDAPILDSDFANWDLSVINAHDLQIVASNIAPLQKDIVSGSNYNIYCTFETPELKTAKYQFMIHNTVTTDVKYLSNRFIITTNQDNTAFIEYRNDYNIYGIQFENLPSDFKISLRLHLNQIELNHETNVKQYRAASTGKLRNISSSPDKVLKLQGFKFDEPAHDAMVALLSFDSLEIEAKNI